MLAKDMIAGFDNPPFDRSPVDGYACKAEDITDASESHPVQLTVLEEIDAGQYGSHKSEGLSSGKNSCSDYRR